LTVINEWEILLRLVIAAALGAIIGVERERSNQPAGLRTHIILAVGSALAMTLSINIAMQFRPLVPNGDPGRIAAQVVSGIGFLGAGAILRYGTSIKGLTTATSLWTLAVVGLVVGAGYYIAAIGTTLILLVVLFILSIIEHRLIAPYQNFMLTISADDRHGFIVDFKKLMERRAIKFSRLTIQKNLKRKMIKVETQVQIRNEDGIEPLMNELGTLPGVRAYKIA
jgi:putative Mg2+ transporter-C (MgtC) family protein